MLEKYEVFRLTFDESRRLEQAYELILKSALSYGEVRVSQCAKQDIMAHERGNSVFVL